MHRNFTGNFVRSLNGASRNNFWKLIPGFSIESCKLRPFLRPNLLNQDFNCWGTLSFYPKISTFAAVKILPMIQHRGCITVYLLRSCYTAHCIRLGVYRPAKTVCNQWTCLSDRGGQSAFLFCIIVARFCCCRVSEGGIGRQLLCVSCCSAAIRRRHRLQTDRHVESVRQCS